MSENRQTNSFVTQPDRFMNRDKLVDRKQTDGTRDNHRDAPLGRKRSKRGTTEKLIEDCELEAFVKFARTRPTRRARAEGEKILRKTG